MVVPLHTEQDWLPMFTGLRRFAPGPRPIVFLSPHPDDETLSAGGLLASQWQRGCPVTVIAVTDGEHAYAENNGLAKQRIDEQTRAAMRLGMKDRHLVRLHLADSGVTGQRSELSKKLSPLVSEGTHLIAPWPHDFHPDHEACGEVARELAERTGCCLTFYFFWTWHRGTPDLLRNLPLRAFPLSAELLTAKAEALAMHVSQLSHPSGDPILHSEHLWPARLPFEVYLPA